MSARPDTVGTIGTGPRDLALVMRRLDEPCLWIWEIRDSRDMRLVESSWTSEWTAFGTRNEARRGGVLRLAELICPAGRLDRGRPPMSHCQRKASVAPMMCAA